ncbi:MAG: cyclic nucleotide-binding domain-containing protein, partial [Desulfohalobiaceae bacterium]
MQLPFFRQLSQQALQDLVKDMDILCIPSGEVLIRPGEENHCLYLLLSGRLEVHLDAEDSVDSMMVEAGECVGEMSIIEQCPTTAWVIGQQPSTLLVMSEKVFWERFVVIPGVLQHLFQVLVQRMRAINDQVVTSMKTRMHYQILQRELEYAGRIQASLLPQNDPFLPNHPQVEVSALMQPATQVGGDFYDVLALDSERIAVAVGDISGKGMPA